MKKVLIVDPSKTFAEFARLVLTRLGYETRYAANGEAAQSLLQGAPPDLVLTEANLPGMPGAELCRRVKGCQAGSGIPVVMVARNGTAEAKEAALSAGCSEFLSKPVTSRTLHELMQRRLPFSPRRRALRARMSVNATVLGESAKEVLRTSTIGEAGLFLERARPHAEGTRLFIALPLPNLKSALTFTGVVAYSLDAPRGGFKPGMGVKFTDLDPNTATLFSHYMENYVSGFLRGVPRDMGCS